MNDQALIVLASAMRAIGEILVGSIVISLYLHTIKQAILEAGEIEGLIRQRKYGMIGIMLIVAGFILETFIRLRAA